MSSKQAIKDRIKSIKNTNKVTRTLEKISAVKRQRFSNLAVESKPYALEIVKTNTLFARDLEISEDSPKLLHSRSVDSVLFIIFTSDRGLCGSYNSNIIKTTQNLYTEFISKNPEIVVKLMCVGKRGGKIAKSLNIDLVSLYEKIFENPTYLKAYEIGKEITAGFVSDQYDEVYLIFTNYQTISVQNIVIDKLIPFKQRAIEATIALESITLEEPSAETTSRIQESATYKIEPDIESVQEYLFQRHINTRIYQAILDSSASEHTSRMIAMKNASDNATDLSYALTLTYNKNRQASITQEVSEIVAGIEAIGEIN